MGFCLGCILRGRKDASFIIRIGFYARFESLSLTAVF